MRPAGVRPARPEDHEALLALWERSVRATHHFLTEDDITTLRPLVAQELAGTEIGWWVLVSGTDAPCGFLGYTPDRIEALFIDPAHRGQGGGTLLIEQAERLATGPLAVEANEQNPEAVGFYKAQGFQVVSRTDTDSGGRPFPLLQMRRTP
jgi:putative acetyltransferase